MPADDRDPKFERALAHHLRGDSAAACPDAEILAAYHERSLSLEEMAHWKQHISGCAACQESLALVEATEHQLAEKWQEQDMPVPVAAGILQVRSKAVSEPTAEEVSLGQDSPTAAAPVEISKRRRPLLLRWAVPVGALAAAVLIWIGVHEQRNMLRIQHSESVQMAKNQSPAAPEQKTNETLPSGQNSSGAQLDMEARPVQSETPKLESRRMSPPMVRAGSVEKDVGAAKKKSGKQTADVYTYNSAAPPAPANAPVPSPPAVATQSVEVSAAAQPVQTESAPSGASVGGMAANRAKSADNKSAAPQAAAKQKAETLQQETINQNTTDAMMLKQGVNGRTKTSLAALAPATSIILTPDNKVWWKLGSAGIVQVTTDGGTTWKSLDTGVNGQLTAGFASSSRVCWMVGKSGTIVLTTDRGKHWKKIDSPIAGDLGGVHAADDKHAAIWAASDRVSFETSDGGATWKPIANQ